MATKWRVEQKEDKINLYFEGDKETVEVPDVTAGEAEEMADALMIAIFRAKRWRKINMPMCSELVV